MKATRILCLSLLVLVVGPTVTAQEAPVSDLAEALRKLDAEIAAAEEELRIQSVVLSKAAMEAKQAAIGRRRAQRARLAASLPSGAPAVPEASLDEKRAADLVQSAPGLAASSGRTFVGIRKIERLEAGGEAGWLVEFQWKEGGDLHTGVVPVQSVTREKAAGWHFWDQGWGIVAFIPDHTIDTVKTQMKAARIGAFESSALGDVRTVMSAELTYQSENQGFFDLPECLIAPAKCLPGYRGPQLLSGKETLAERFGYRRVFHAGPKARPKAKASPSSITTFAFTVVPITVGETGVRAFCGDDTGRICVTADGSAPRVVDGRCGAPCEELK